MSKKEKMPLDMQRVSRIFSKLYQVLLKKTNSPVEALSVLKFGVAFFEISIGVEYADDSEIRAFIKETLKQVKQE